MELVALPAMDLERVRRNREEGKALNFVGDAKLYVGNLSFDCTEQLLYETFSEFGTVGEISMVYDNDTGRPRGFAFVTMRTQMDAQNLLQQQGAALQIMGRELSIREANT
jgi:cold-inducible RNA-binding protein